MELGLGETVGVSASVDEDDTWSELGDVFIEEYDLHETPIGTSWVDVVVVGLANIGKTYPLLTWFKFTFNCQMQLNCWPHYIWNWFI